MEYNFTLLNSSMLETVFCDWSPLFMDKSETFGSQTDNRNIIEKEILMNVLLTILYVLLDNVFSKYRICKIQCVLSKKGKFVGRYMKTEHVELARQWNFCK